MGLSSSTTKTKNTPVYASQIEGAANNVNNAYNAQSGKITGITDQLAGLVPNLVSQYQNGDPNVNAAKGYNLDVLSGKYLNGNPQLDNIVQQGENDARNQTAAALGTRGLTGGSAFGDIISRNVANLGNTLRYNDYNTQLTRMDNATGQAANLSAASQIPLTAIQSILESQQVPVQAAAGAGNAIGGLLGQYTNTTQKSSPSIGMLLAQMAGNAASAWAGGGFGK